MADFKCKEHRWEWTDGDPGCPFCLRSKLETSQRDADLCRAQLLDAQLQIGEWRDAAIELIKAPHNSFADAAARERVKGLIRGDAEKRVEEVKPDDLPPCCKASYNRGWNAGVDLT